MSLIICQKKAEKPYRIKEVDINVWTIEELCYFIYNFTILISSDFLCPNLLFFIYSNLNMQALANKLNAMEQKNESIAKRLYTILDYSFLYSKEELNKFKSNVSKITAMNLNEQKELAGDYLFSLKKYEKAIKRYELMSDSSYSKYKKIAFAYSKQQNYDKAIQFFDKGINLIDSVDIEKVPEDRREEYNKKLIAARMELLKNLYFVCKLNSTKDLFDKYTKRIDDTTLTDWDIEFIQVGLKVKNDNNLKGLDEVFLMDDEFIRTNVSSIIKSWKERYRGLV